MTMSDAGGEETAVTSRWGKAWSSTVQITG